MDKDEKRLIKRALAGDEEARSEMVKTNWAMARRVILNVTRRPDLVDDLCQEAFLQAFRKLGKFRGHSKFSTWLYRVCVNVSIDALKKEDATRRTRDAALELGDLPDVIIVKPPRSGERLLLDKEMQARVSRAILNISAKSRAILSLRYVEELSTPEISRMLDIPEGTARSRLYYARLELADALSDYIGPGEASALKRGKKDARKET